MEQEREGGLRCRECYRTRLDKTAGFVKDKDIARFATTLTISPFKDAEVINRVGNEIAASCGLDFYEADFKKKDGFKKSCEMSKQMHLHRQNYCGCEYSMREKFL